MLLIIVIIILIVALLGTGPWTPYGANWGYGPSGFIVLVLVVVVILALLGRL